MVPSPLISNVPCLKKSQGAFGLVVGAHDGVEASDALLERKVEEVRPVHVQDVEEESMKRHGRYRFGDVG